MQENAFNRSRIDFNLQRPGSIGNRSLPACRERWRSAANQFQLAATGLNRQRVAAD